MDRVIKAMEMLYSAVEDEVKAHGKFRHDEYEIVLDQDTFAEMHFTEDICHDESDYVKVSGMDVVVHADIDCDVVLKLRRKSG